MIETERAQLCIMQPEHVNMMMSFTQLHEKECLTWINENIAQEQQRGFSIYNVFLKQTQKYIGYCGCNDIELAGFPEVQLLWDLYKKYKEDDIEIEVAFALRNYIFKHFDIHSLVSLIRTTDIPDTYIAEAIDMENEGTLNIDGQKHFVYRVSRNSPKFLASFGDGESCVLTSTLNYRENAPSPVKNLKRPRPRPK